MCPESRGLRQIVKAQIEHLCRYKTLWNDFCSSDVGSPDTVWFPDALMQPCADDVGVLTPTGRLLP
jgi:hypothetical protein